MILYLYIKNKGRKIMEEKAIVTTRFICIDSRNEYHMKWHKKITDTNPLFTHNGKLSFAIVGTKGRMEVNTLDMNYLESCAKLMTVPKGRSSVSSDKAYIYIKEKDGKTQMLGTLTHNYIKTFVPANSRKALE